MFIAFRFVTGWGAFQSLASVPLWVGEIVPPRNRGRLVDIHAVLLKFGYTLAGYVGVGFYSYSGNEHWRAALSFVMLFPAILLAGIHWMPESPRYLLSKGRVEEAWAVVKRLRSDPQDSSDEYAEREFYQMPKQIELDATLKASYLDTFRRPSYRKPALITIYLFFSLVSSGVLVINSPYSVGVVTCVLLTKPRLWRSAVLRAALRRYRGLAAPGRLDTYWTCHKRSGYNICDKLPRPYLTSLGFVLCTLTLIVDVALQKNFLYTKYPGGLSAAVAMLFLFFIFNSLTLDGTSYFYIGELWPSHLRAQGFTLALVTLCVINLAWVEAAPYAFAAIGWKYYISFIVLSALAAVVSFLTFPDTLHKPLEEIALLFGDSDQVVVDQRQLAGAYLSRDILNAEDTEIEKI
ncbi:hypothetical protein LTR78_010121 [Recurvomyces mirabilis]|uniref:Major facilitator superfamily (MFS) profile domain-containing protein n=1 Tax=Recurvomyces mirabilis TaxID=574656 RepID=A0AAE0TMY4_9PEZI|nr:hypothetical protein LTR78_010121 [Recurvomyces mirabilis]KAK5150053.1 hypothetical protein LTS14_010418 [Recurvomyces mirabilis]